MNFDDLPNELLFSTFHWLPYAQRAGVGRVCQNWNYLIDVPRRSEMKSLFPFLSGIAELSTAELDKLPEKMEALYAFIAGTYEISLPLLLDFVQNPTSSENLSEEDKITLRHFAEAINYPFSIKDIDQKKVSDLAAALGNKEKLERLEREKAICMQTRKSALMIAASHGQLDCLTYLDKEDIRLETLKNRGNEFNSVYEMAFLHAAGAGNMLESLKPLLKWNNLPCIKYLIEKHAESISLVVIREAIHSTCKSDNHLPSFEYLCEIMEKKEKKFLKENKESLRREASPACREYLESLIERKNKHHCVMF